ncbi:MAG: hypothetical protein PHH28_06000 [Desulfuromonadaceae bacterium]|nr:hypothetical protein [Desulfuromonadaceae bacterium]
MNLLLSLLLCFLLLATGAAFAAPPGEGEATNYRMDATNKMDCDNGPTWCNKESRPYKCGMRGRCGKRRGDWYGARQPVSNATEARNLIQNYFAGQGYTTSGVTERRWGFWAEIIDKDGKIVDRVMIDKRSGRIRSLY